MRLTGKPPDESNDTRNYQYPPENHKNPPESAKGPESKIHHIVCLIITAKGRRPSSPHHVHHWHPAEAFRRKRRRSVATGEPLAHDDMNLLLAVFTMRLNHHRIHGGVRISGHLAHKVFAQNSELLIVQIRTSDSLYLKF